MTDQNWKTHVCDAKKVPQRDVVHFFCCTIGGICGKDGPKNIDNLREMLTINDWYLCKLKRTAFDNLSVPDESRVLLGEKNIHHESVKNFDYWLKYLRECGVIPPLILKMPKEDADPVNASFGILDGSSRAQTYMHFLQKDEKAEFSLNAYLGILNGA